MEGLFEKIEVANKRQCQRTWRQFPFVGCIRENEFYKDKDSNGKEDALKIEGIRHCQIE